jgi:spore cortex formation protein SpoVR/YcgB (stage V sporulation)
MSILDAEDQRLYPVVGEDDAELVAIRGFNNPKTGIKTFAFDYVDSTGKQRSGTIDYRFADKGARRVKAAVAEILTSKHKKEITTYDLAEYKDEALAMTGFENGKEKLPFEWSPKKPVPIKAIGQENKGFVSLLIKAR